MTAITIADLNNAKLDIDHVAAIALSTAPTATDRLGGTKKTLSAAINSLVAFTPRGAWVTATAYSTRDLVSDGGTWYVCLVAHTSSASFATDVASKWGVHQGVIQSVLDAALRTHIGLQTGSRKDAYRLSFTDNYRSGETPAAVRVIGGATAVMNATGELEVDSNYNTLTKVVYIPKTFAEGRFLVRMKNSPFMIVFAQKDRTGRCIWSQGGVSADLNVGTSNSISQVQAKVTSTVPGFALGDDIWIELMTGPNVAGVGYNIRVWKYTDPRPQAKSFSGTYAATGYGGVATEGWNEGDIVLASFTGSVAKYKEIILQDGSDGAVQICGQAAFVGRWFTRFDGYKACMTTVLGGSKFRFKLSKSARVAARFCGPLGVVGGYDPVVDVFVNGAYFGTNTMTVAVGALGVTDLVSGLDASLDYNVEVRVRGVNEANNKWMYGSGLLMESLYAYGGVLVPWEDTRPKMLFIGDSITEGILGHSSGASTPIRSAGDLSWPVLTCEALDLQPVVNGFGGTGLTVAGSGGMPVTSTNAFYYMVGRAIDTYKEDIQFIVVNIGTNDSAAGGPTFQAAYSALIAQIFNKYPSVQKVWAMRPFNGQYAAEISAAVTASGDPRLAYINTSSWSSITYTDGIHPDLAGHAAAAAYLVTALSDMQAGTIT